MKAAVLTLFAALALGGCRDPDRIEIHTGEAMGTSYRIKTVGGVDFNRVGIGEMLAELDRDLSTWRDDSWAAEFNRAPAGTTMEMPESVVILLEMSKRYHAQTDGRFDPTVGALIRVWGFGAWRDGWSGEPTDDEVAAAREASGFDNIRVEGRRISKLHDRLMLDFSGIAKGYAVDRMGDLLRAAGCRDFIIDFGGDVLASGHAPGKQGWTVGGPALERPVMLHDEALATSGSEHQFRGSYAHIIDPRTGRPVAAGPPVSARASTCAKADALATAGVIEAGERAP